MAKPPALPIGLPGGELVPFLSSRRRHDLCDVVFEMIGGVERMAAWADKEPGEFYKTVWSKGLPKMANTEHHASEGVEALLEKLDRAERETIDITPQDIT